MKFFATFATVALFFAAGSAHAGGTIASAPAFGSYQQQSARCFVTNVGTKPVLADISIFDESGGKLTPLVDPGETLCSTVPIAPGATCTIVVNIPTGVAFACSATALSGSIKNLRGTFVIEVSSPTLVPARREALR
jgi:hypothetical protein